MKTEPQEKQYLTPPDVARMWGVHLSKVMGFIESGELPAINMAKDAKGERPRYRVRLSDIELFETGRMTTQAVVKRQRRRSARRDPGRVNRYPE